MRTLLAACLVALVCPPAGAIVIRHDRDDARHLELARSYPATVTVLPDGTGTLVAPRWVLTAAHVARGLGGPPERVEVGGREYEVARAILHPDWRRGGDPHDIALLELARPVEGVTPAVPYPRDDERGRVVTFVGRGDVGTGLTGPVGRADASRAATNTVESVDADWIRFTFDRGAAATDLEGVSGPGDSGGPAFLELDGTLYTLGVSALCEPRGLGGPGRYGVGEAYTRVSTHRSWIDGVIAGTATGRVLDPSTPGELPDSPAGRAVADWLAAYGRDDLSAMRDHVARAFSAGFLERRPVERQLELVGRLRDELFGGLVVDRVIDEDASGITVLFRSDRGPLAEIRFGLAPGTPPLVDSLRVAVVELD